MQAKQPKKSPLGNRSGSATAREAGSTSASPAADSKKRGYANIWPEWNDADVNAEKWETAHKGGKEKEKGKSPVVAHFFEDPDGRIELPHILKTDYWKRPQDFIVETTPVVVDQNHLSGFDLLTANDPIHESELMRYITSEIVALWKHSRMKHAQTDSTACLDPNLPFDGEYIYTWRPWEHIYAINKVTKGPTIPLYNPHGKYAIRLYWLGCWRKIIIDDTIPYNDSDQMLLPATTRPHELWPMLLTKALVKVASLDYNGGNNACEFGDFSVIQCLTGWLPEAIPLQMGHMEEIWELLRVSLPEFQLPELPSTEERAVSEERNKEDTPVDIKDEKSEKEKSNLEKVEAAKPTAAAKSGKPDKDKGKDDKKEKKGQEKERAKEKSIVQDELPIPDHPEYMVFASYVGPLKYPIKVSALSDMANASEQLRLAGFSHLYPHPVNIKQTRSCPLEPPPPPEKIPAWKLIRPRKKRVTPSDEPIAEPEPEKPIQALEITSPFINYKVSPVPIPAETHRPRSTLTRGSTRVSSRPGTANPPSIEEGDEDVSQSDSNPEMTETQNQLTVDNLPQETKMSEVETVSDLDPHTEVQEKGMSGKEKAGDKSAGKKRTLSSKAKSEKSDKSEKVEKSEKEKESERGKSPGGKKKGASNRDSADSKQKTTEKPNALDNAVDAADLSAALEAQLEERGAEVTGSEEKVTAVSTTMQDIWMDFSILCKCFKTLYIYHKPLTYPHNYKHSDIKTAVEKTPEEKLQNFLFVDNLKPTDIVVAFSALSHWNDPPPPLKEDSKVNMGRKDRESRGDALANENSSVMEVVSLHEPTHLEPLTPGVLIAEPYSWKSLITGQPMLRLRTTSIRTAVLSLPEGRHVLRFNMSSPLGCHLHICSTVNFVFGEEERVMAELTKESCRFTENANQVMTALGKCIANFNDGEMFQQTWDEFYSSHCPYRRDPTMSKHYHFEMFNEALYLMLRKVLTEPQLVNPEMALAWRAFTFDCTTKNILGLHYTSSSRPTTGITSDRGSAKKGGGAKRRKSIGERRRSIETPNSANADSFSGDPQEAKVDTARNREPTAEDHVAAIKIQMYWRGYWVRYVKAARTPGTKENLHAHELLQKAWPVFEANLEQNGLLLFRNLFKLAPELMPKYSFYKDEWNKISYSDYQGNYPEQPANTWFVVFREVFHVVEDMLCMPKLYTSIPTCMLRVVNNDTGEEVPRIFQKVAPYVYKKNVHGYTFVAEARSVDQGIPPGRWRLRLIGSLSPLPTPQHGEVNAAFQTTELHDFYVPNDRNIVFRYSVKVTEDHLVSLQMATSKSDVVVRLEILDHEEVKTTATGKAHVVLPAFVFQKDPSPNTPAVNSQTGASEEETSRRSGSRMSAGRHSSVLSKVHGSGSNQVIMSKKRTGSGAHDGRGSHASTQLSVCSLEDDEEREPAKPHKYIIQAVVLRNSWPLSESQWAFVQGLKELEKAEIKVAAAPSSDLSKVSSKDHQSSPQPKSVPSKDTGTKSKDKIGKKAGGKADKEKDVKSSSRPPSQHFDLSKPNWLLRVVSDATSADDIEVKKDTERVDEIRAMKKAWEDAEPGRAAKAMQSRLQYLSTHLVKIHTEDEEGVKSDVSKSDLSRSDEKELIDVDNLQPGDDLTSPPLEISDAEPVLTLENPNPPVPKEALQDIDLTPFIRETTSHPRLLDLEELQHQLEDKQREIQEFRLYREQVEKRRDTERAERNKLKIRQLELFEEMQATLDALRAEVNEPREEFRQRLLAEEQRRQEALAAADAALRAEQERNAPSPKGKKSPKAKSAKKK